MLGGDVLEDELKRMVGNDFSFVGEEYRVQVGNSDFKIDLLFFNRELACLVANYQLHLPNKKLLENKLREH